MNHVRSLHSRPTHLTKRLEYDDTHAIRLIHTSSLNLHWQPQCTMRVEVNELIGQSACFRSEHQYVAMAVFDLGIDSLPFRFDHPHSRRVELLDEAVPMVDNLPIQMLPI